MLDWYRIKKAAKNLGLQDRGNIESTYYSNNLERIVLHEFCNTRLRIGIDIDHEGLVVRYCWRCEYILPPMYDPPPGGEREPQPAGEEKSEIGRKGVVIPFPQKKTA